MVIYTSKDNTVNFEDHNNDDDDFGWDDNEHLWNGLGHLLAFVKKWIKKNSKNKFEKIMMSTYDMVSAPFGRSMMTMTTMMMTTMMTMTTMMMMMMMVMMFQ